MSLGIGAMLHMLGGGSKHSADKYYGKTIEKATFQDDALLLKFSDGITIKISDGGQSCCEHRYMTTDDIVSFLDGKVLTGIEIKDGPNAEDSYGDHEIQFMEVSTPIGSITFCSHNEHNGYYGGICLSIDEV